MVKETIFMIIAILITTAEPKKEEVVTHPHYKFQTVEECRAFVQFNYQNLYMGLVTQLAQIQSDKMIKEIACGEYDIDPTQVKEASHTFSPTYY